MAEGGIDLGSIAAMLQGIIEGQNGFDQRFDCVDERFDTMALELRDTCF